MLCWDNKMGCEIKMGKRVNPQPRCPLCGRFCSEIELLINWDTCERCYNVTKNRIQWYNEDDMEAEDFNPNHY